MLCLLPGYGQQFSFIHHNIEDGLAQSQVRAITQDYRGYIWFATMGGASRFDGRKFTNYSTAHGLIDNQINCFFEDQDYRLWFGCAGGISVFNGTTFKSYPLPDDISNFMVLDIIEHVPGELLLATNGAGLLKLNLSTSAFQLVESIPKDELVRKLKHTPQGDLLIGSRNGLYQSVQGQLDNVELIHPNFSVSDVVIGDEGRVSVATFGNGILIIDNDDTLNITEKRGLQNDFVREIARDSAGFLWVASRSGLNKLSPEGIPVFNTNIGLNYENIKTLFIDREENLWIGTDGKGVYRLTGEQFITFSKRDGLVSDIVMSITRDKQNRMWLGSYDNGVCVIQDDSAHFFNTENGLLHNTVWCSLSDRNGCLWFGTNTGISRYTGERFINYTESEPGKFFERVTAIFEDHKGSIWFGTVSGIAIYHGDRFLNSDEIGHFPGTRVRYIFQEDENTMWFGAENGLIKYHNGKYTTFPIPGGTKNSVVYNVTQDHTGRLWVGTKGGLYTMTAEELSIVNFSDGFGSNNVNFLQPDNQGLLYIGTNNGLFVLDSDAYHKQKIIRTQHFTDQEGLASLECNQNAVFLDHDNTLWFGTTEGVIQFEPKQAPFADNHLSPKIEISNVKLILEEKNWKEFADSIDIRTGLPVGVELFHKNNHLTFEFVGMYFSNPDKVLYRYMLEGIDEDWLPETATNNATYASLPHGEYTFKVSGRIDGEDWGENTDAFSFSILPPFYLTWWFIVIAIVTGMLVVAGLVFALLKNEKRKRRTQQLIYASRMLALEQQTLNSSMNRHFIFNALNSIQYYINRQDKLAANKYLSSFARLIRKNLDSSQANFTTLSDEIERIELYLELENMRFPDKFTYHVYIDPAVDTHTVMIPAMLFQPYLENSIWHGILPMKTPGEISLRVEQKDDDLVIKIKDNGIGIDESRKIRQENNNSHIPQGMLINQNRIDLFRKMTDQNFKIEGPYDLKNLPLNETGTAVEITFPIKTSLQSTLSS